MIKKKKNRDEGSYAMWSSLYDDRCQLNKKMDGDGLCRCVSCVSLCLLDE